MLAECYNIQLYFSSPLQKAFTNMSWNFCHRNIIHYYSQILLYSAFVTNRTMVTLREDHIDLFDARGRCREKMEINVYPDNSQNRVFCSGHEDTFGSTYTLETVNHKIDIDFNKCDSLQGGQFRFQFTGEKYSF